MSRRNLLDKLSFQDIDKILGETRRKPMPSQERNNDELLQGYDNMKYSQNRETIKATIHSMVQSADLKPHEQSPQRECSGSSNVQISVNKSWEKVLPIEKQKSIDQPLCLQKTKPKNEAVELQMEGNMGSDILRRKRLSRQRNSALSKNRRMLDSLSVLEGDDECLKSAVEGQVVEGKAESLSLMELSNKIVNFAVVLNKWTDRRCELCNTRLTSFNLIKKQTQWCSKTCKTLKFLQQDRSTAAGKGIRKGTL
ncbi:hypothetical protein ACH3XW_39360 [Acanthocheilonema viteae]